MLVTTCRDEFGISAEELYMFLGLDTRPVVDAHSITEGLADTCVINSAKQNIEHVIY